MTRKSVLLADDHRIVSDGLKSILADHYDLAGIVENGRDLLVAAKDCSPDVIVVDISMPLLNGLDAVSRLRSEGCRAKIVFLTMHKDLIYAGKAIALGASGFVLKHSASSELLKAIAIALNDETFISPELDFHGQASRVDGAAVSDPPALTVRQREVLQLFAEGRSAKEVGAALGISSRTAENHKHRIVTQLGISSTADLIQYAMRHGLIAAP